MDDITRIPWGNVIANFLWVLGAALFLAAFSYHEFLVHMQKAKRKEILKINSFKTPFLVALILITMGVFSSSLLHIFSASPEIIIKDMVKFPPSSLEGPKQIEGDLIIMPWTGIIKSKKIQFEKSKYEIRIISKGSKSLEETARLKVYVGINFSINLIADYFTSTEYQEKIIEFISKKKKIKRIRIEFVNDYVDPVTKQDRNALIKSIVIIKKDNIKK